MRAFKIALAAGTVLIATACAQNGPQGNSANNSATFATTPPSEQIDASCRKLRHTVNIGYNLEAKSFEAAAEKFDQRLLLLNKFAAEKHLTQLSVVAMDYTFNAQPNVNRPNLSAKKYYKMRAVYEVASSDDAFAIADHFILQKWNIIVAVRNPCNIADTLEFED